MARTANKLSVKYCEKPDLKSGLYGDGNGLYLQVSDRQTKSWVCRFMIAGKARKMGLGDLKRVTLAEARKKATAAHLLVIDGIDPIADRNARRAALAVAAAKTLTFKECAEQFIASHKSGWKNAKHAAQWTATLEAYVHPTIGALPVALVDASLVLKVLRPIWTDKTETASRVRGRIESILDWARVGGFREGENPARWKGHLEHSLPKRSTVAQGKHHAALPYSELPAFWSSLAADTSDAARMLRFVILTACRFGEAAGMQPGEVEGDVWTIPKGRMKAGRSHTVPLTPLAKACLPFEPVSDVKLSRVIRRHTALPATTHGMRSTFRDWCGDMSGFPREIAEMALAHTVGDETEQAYRRATAILKRRQLMEDWANYCGGKTVGVDNVVAIGGRK